jgi:hypothetical protein
MLIPNIVLVLHANKQLTMKTMKYWLFFDIFAWKYIYPFFLLKSKIRMSDLVIAYCHTMPYKKINWRRLVTYRKYARSFWVTINAHTINTTLLALAAITIGFRMKNYLCKWIFTDFHYEIIAKIEDQKDQKSDKFS